MRWRTVVGSGVVVLATACQAHAAGEPHSQTQLATETAPESHGHSGSTPS